MALPNKRNLFFISFLFCSLLLNAQFEESEKEKFKQLNKFLFEKGILKEENIPDNDIFNYVFTRNLIKSNYQINFKIISFQLKDCMDCQNFICIESGSGFEIFELCNIGPFYSSLFCHLEKNPNLTKTQILNFLKEVSYEIEILIQLPLGGGCAANLRYSDGASL